MVFNEMKSLKNRSGMSLVEITVATLVLSFVLLSAGSIYVSGVKEFRRAVAEARVQTDMSFVLDHIFMNLINAKGIESITSNDIVVLTDVPELAPKIEYKLSGSSVIFYYKLGVTGQAQETLSDNIESISFTRPLTKNADGSGGAINNYVSIALTVAISGMRRATSTGVALRGMSGA